MTKVGQRGRAGRQVLVNQAKQGKVGWKKIVYSAMKVDCIYIEGVGGEISRTVWLLGKVVASAAI